MLDPPPGSVSFLPFRERPFWSHVEISVCLDSISWNLAFLWHYLDKVGWIPCCVSHVLSTFLNDGNRGVDLPIAESVFLTKSQAKVEEPPKVNCALLYPQGARVLLVTVTVGFPLTVFNAVRQQLSCLYCHFNDVPVKVIFGCQHWIIVEQEDVHVAFFQSIGIAGFSSKPSPLQRLQTLWLTIMTPSPSHFGHPWIFPALKRRCGFSQERWRM